MLIKIGYDLEFELAAPTPMILLLYVHPERTGDLAAPEWLISEPRVEVHNYIDGFGNRCARVVAPAGKFRVFHQQTIRDSGEPDAQDATAIQHPLQDVPPAHLQFLMPSRYCEVDRFMELAWQMFG